MSGSTAQTPPTPCPRCGYTAAGVRCPRCDAVKVLSCTGACITCTLSAACSVKE